MTKSALFLLGSLAMGFISPRLAAQTTPIPDCSTMAHPQRDDCEAAIKDLQPTPLPFPVPEPKCGHKGQRPCIRFVNYPDSGYTIQRLSYVYNPCKYVSVEDMIAVDNATVFHADYRKALQQTTDWVTFGPQLNSSSEGRYVLLNCGKYVPKLDDESIKVPQNPKSTAHRLNEMYYWTTNVVIGHTVASTVRALLGEPNHVNSTKTAAGTREQWVYPHRFVYLPNGIVSAIQTSK